MENKSNETGFFVACQSGDITTAKVLLQLVHPSSLSTTWEGRTCLHMAVIAGDSDLLRELVAKLRDPYLLSQLPELINIIEKRDKKGDTALHLAVRKYLLDVVEQLANLDSNLCDCENNDGETPLKMAVRLGFKEAVGLLITRTSTNALHFVVELNQVKLVQFLMKKNVDLSKLINQPYQHSKQKGPANASGDGDKPSHSAARNKNKANGEGDGDTNNKPKENPFTNASHDEGNGNTNGNTNPSGHKGNGNTDVQHDQPIVREGDTPLHIAARNKYEHMVNLLLQVRGVNKLAWNSDEQTPLEIAREVMEYHESFRIIRKLGDYGRRPKPFMYCAPQVSHKKLREAREKVKEAYEARRNSELVVAALLAAMTCAAAFTVPGGFESESKEMKELGSPLLIHLTSFKLFLIFDCIAFFLSLFVCIMWEMSSELTTGDKMLFMTVNSLVVCCSFGSTSFAFMCAVYSMLARKVETFSWVVLGSLIAIASFGVIAFIRQLVMFASTRARFHRLCGVSCVVDDFAEKVWSLEERWGILKPFRSGGERYQDLITGHRKFREHNSPSSAAHENKSSSSSHLALEL